MRALYIGIYSEGSTSKMRALEIGTILQDWSIDIINTDIPKQQMSRLWQSIGFRYKRGPLICKVNNYVLSNLATNYYDVIWVDKAIYLTKNTTEILRERADKLVHYTPDPAFTFHRSKLFYESLPLYDYVVTTKSFEIDEYVRVIGNKEKVLYATQGFDKNLHRPIAQWGDKKGVAFIGHYEKERMKTIELFLNNGVEVTLAGIGWEPFAKSHRSCCLNYLGSGVFGEDYVKAISNCLFAWGAISKWIPEKHTTRTFEIPACKTALLTERNSEIESFFSDDEVVFYDNINDLIEKVIYYNNHKDELKELIEKGYHKVQSGGFDYESIMKKLLIRMGIL